MNSSAPCADLVPVLLVLCDPVLGANGDEERSHPPIDSWRESRRLQDTIHGLGAPGPGPIMVRLLRPPTLQNLQETLEHGPAAYPLVHVIGYVPPDGNLRMEDDHGREAPVTPEQFAAVFWNRSVRMALLTFCHGEPYARCLVAASVDAVITVSGVITDAEAALVAREVYLHLGAGRSMQEAHQAAGNALEQAYLEKAFAGPNTGRRTVAEWKQYARARKENLVLLKNNVASLPLPPNRWGSTRGYVDLGEPRSNLPGTDEFLIGRGKELVELSEQLSDRKGVRKLILLSGLQGIGKSSLALAAARRNSWRFSGIVYFNPRLDRPRGLTSVDHMYQQIDGALQLTNALAASPHLEAKQQQVINLFKRSRHLLVFDHFDELDTEQKAEAFRWLLALDSQNGTVALLTQRGRDLPSELTSHASAAFSLQVSPLDPRSSVAWLSRYLASTGQLHEASQGHDLDQLAKATHGHPKLLQLCADKLRTTCCNDLLDQLQNLTGELGAAVDSLIGGLCRELINRDPAALRLLRTMQLFPHGTEPKAVWWVWSGKGALDASHQPSWERAMLSGLIGHEQGRVQLIPLAQHYLKHREAPDQVESEPMAEQHADFFLRLVRNSRNNFDRLKAERANIQSALEWAIEREALETIAGFAEGLFPFLHEQGSWKEGLELLKQGSDAARGLHKHDLEALLLHEAGVFALQLDDYEKAETCFRASLEVKASLSPPVASYQTLHALGAMYARQKRHADALDCYNKALEEFARGDHGPALTIRVARASVWQDQGELDQARKEFEAILELVREPALRADIFEHLATLARDTGDRTLARLYFAKALEIAESPQKQMTLFYHWGVLEYQDGKYERANDLLLQSLPLTEQVHSLYFRAHNLFWLGKCAKRIGTEAAKAGLYFRQARGLAEQLKLTPLLDKLNSRTTVDERREL